MDRAEIQSRSPSLNPRISKHKTSSVRKTPSSPIIASERRPRATGFARHPQDATKISIKRIIRALNPLQGVTINLNSHQITAAPRPSPEAEETLTTLTIPTGR